MTSELLARDILVYSAAARVAVGPRRLIDIERDRVSEETVKLVTDCAGIAVGDALTLTVATRIREVASTLDKTLSVSFRGNDHDGVVMTIARRQ